MVSSSQQGYHTPIHIYDADTHTHTNNYIHMPTQIHTHTYTYTPTHPHTHIPALQPYNCCNSVAFRAATLWP